MCWMNCSAGSCQKSLLMRVAAVSSKLVMMLLKTTLQRLICTLLECAVNALSLMPEIGKRTQTYIERGSLRCRVNSTPRLQRHNNSNKLHFRILQAASMAFGKSHNDNGHPMIPQQQIRLRPIHRSTVKPQPIFTVVSNMVCSKVITGDHTLSFCVVTTQNGIACHCLSILVSNQRVVTSQRSKQWR